MQSETTHIDLGGFDMGICLRNSAVNTLLEKIWAFKYIPRRISEKISESSIEAAMLCPELLFRPAFNQKETIAFLRLKLTRGEFTTVNQKYEIENWTLSFMIDVKLEIISQTEIEELEKIQKSAKKFLKSFGEDKYIIKYCYCDLKTSGGNRIEINKVESNFPELPGEALLDLEKLIYNFMLGLSGKSNPFIISFCPLLKSPKMSDDRFLPTGVITSMTSMPDKNHMLNFGMMVMGKPFPQGPKAGNIGFHMQKGSLLRISQQAFLVEYFIQVMEAHLEVKFSPLTQGDKSFCEASKNSASAEQRIEIGDDWLTYTNYERLSIQLNFTTANREGIGQTAVAIITGQVSKTSSFTSPPSPDRITLDGGSFSWITEVYFTLDDNRIHTIVRDIKKELKIPPETERWMALVREHGREVAKRYSGRFYSYIINNTHYTKRMHNLKFQAFQNNLVLPVELNYTFKHTSFKWFAPGLNLTKGLAFKL